MNKKIVIRLFFYIFNKQIDKDRMVAKSDKRMQGINKNFILFFNNDVSSNKNRVEIKVVIQEINPKKLLLKIKNTITKL